MSWANRDLERLERRVGDAYERVVRCRRLIQRLSERGDEAKLAAAKTLLTALQRELDELRSHEQVILSELARETEAHMRWRWR
jgi:hypothetical protein